MEYTGIEKSLEMLNLILEDITNYNTADSERYGFIRGEISTAMVTTLITYAEYSTLNEMIELKHKRLCKPLHQIDAEPEYEVEPLNDIELDLT